MRKENGMRIHRRLPVALVPTIVAALAVAWPARAQDPAPRVEVVGRPRLDLGTYEAEKGASGTLEVRNAGAAVLKIRAVRASCGCTETAIDKRELPPGDTATLRVNMKPMSIFGPFTKTVYVESSDPANALLRLEVAGTAVPLVDVRPSHKLHNLRIPLGKRWEQVFTLKPAAGKTVKLGEPQVKSSIPVECAVADAPDGGWHVTVAFEPTAGQGHFQCDVTLPVLVPEAAPPVSLAVMAKIGPALVVSPNAYRLPPEAAAPVEVPLTLSVEAGDGNAPDPATVTWTGIEGVKIEFAAPVSGRLPGKLILPPETIAALPPLQRQILKISAPGMEDAEFSLTHARVPRTATIRSPSVQPSPADARLSELVERVKKLSPEKRADIERLLDEWLRDLPGK
jgi:hypothetical protein